VKRFSIEFSGPDGMSFETKAEGGLSPAQWALAQLVVSTFAHTALAQMLNQPQQIVRAPASAIPNLRKD
jgi:hypothetical protein